MDKTCAVVLAAGEGTRMKSEKPKVLCEVLFKPMLSWVLDAVASANILQCCVVVGPSSQAVQAILPAGCQTAVQSERKGTGHAAMMAKEFLQNRQDDDVLLLYGDAPFVDKETIEGAFSRHKTEGNAVTIVAARVEDPTGYGRVVKEGDKLRAIVEHRDADEKTRAINLINAGIYWFSCRFLLEVFEQLDTGNSQGQYYITDAVSIAVAQHKNVGVYTAQSPNVVLGANDRKQLHMLNMVAREQVIDRLLQDGVDIPITDGVIIAPGVTIAPDTQILPGTIIKGNTAIGSGCVIGPNSIIENSNVGNNVTLEHSKVEESTIADGAKIGPYTRIRPGSVVGKQAKIGNFVEIKNTALGQKASVAHLTYLGDSDVGDFANIGCGVVTANYDGAQKHRTHIGKGAFIGCNTNFIAPVKVGDRSITAAGTTVTEDVPDDSLAIGRPKQVIKVGWAKEKGKYKK